MMLDVLRWLILTFGFLACVGEVSPVDARRQEEKEKPSGQDKLPIQRKGVTAESMRETFRKVFGKDVLETSSDHFAILSNSPKEDVQTILETLERAYATSMKLFPFGRERKEKYPIFFAQTKEDVRKLKEGAGEQYLHCCFTDVRGWCVFSNHKESSDWLFICRHEFGHLFLNLHFDIYPTQDVPWFHESFADYIAAGGSMDGPLRELKKLFEGNPDGKSRPTDLERTLKQRKSSFTCMLVEMIHRKYPDKFRKLLEGFKDVKKQKKLFEELYMSDGKKALAKELQEYIDQRLKDLKEPADGKKDK